MKELDAEDFFTASSSGLHELQGYENNTENSSDLILFHKHFMLMHVLYTLQDDLLLEGVILTVSPLKIKLTDYMPDKLIEDERGRNQAFNHLALGEDGKLKDYYLDWVNFTSTTDQNIKDMLNSFWKKLLDPEETASAFHVLELPVASSQEEIKKSYRKLAAIHHPDKGGDKEVFIRIQSAFERLKN